jgi:MFS superfamily sulfate permease-like transporter
MPADRRSTSHPEELILYGLLVGIGAIPVAIALVRHAAFGVEATLGLLMVCAGGIGAVTYARRIHRNRMA